MVGTRRREQYNQDLMVLGISTLLVFIIWAATDLASGPSDYFTASWGPPTTDADGGNGDGPPEPIIEEEVLVSDSGHNEEGTTTDIDFEVPWTTTQEITATLEWSDDIGNNDEFELTLLLDGEELDSKGGASGNLVITITAPSEGNYTIIVRAVDCPGVISPLPIGLDGGNDWSLEVKATYEVMK